MKLLCANPVCIEPQMSNTSFGLCQYCIKNFTRGNMPVYGYPVLDDLKALSKLLKAEWNLSATDEATILRKMAGSKGSKWLNRWDLRPQPDAMSLWRNYGGRNKLRPIRFRMPELLLGRYTKPSMAVIREAFIGAMVAYEVLAGDAGIHRHKRKKIADWYAGCIFLRQVGLEDRHNGKLRIAFYTFNDYAAVGNLLLDSVFDQLKGAKEGFIRRARTEALYEWSFKIGTWWWEGEYLSAKYWPGTYKCPRLKDRLWAHWVPPKTKFLPDHLKHYSNCRRGFRGLIKGKRHWDLDQPLDHVRSLKLAQLNSIKITGLPRIEKVPKPTHKPDTSWIL